MKNKFVLASLTAIALTVLSACGSTVQGAAQEGGAGSVASAPVAPSDITSDEDTNAPETTADETTADETTPDETTADGPTADETTADGPTADETTADETTDGTGDVDLESCKAVSDFTTAFAGMVQKIQGGTISQSDVDTVFSDDVKAGLPADAQATFEKLKNLSNRMVGKSMSDLADVATELTDAANELRDIIKSACGVG